MIRRVQRRPAARHLWRGLRGLAAAVVLLLPAAALAPAVRAANGVEIRATTTYSLRPEAKVVRVRIDVDFKNVTPDTADDRIFYTGYALVVHPEASSITASRLEQQLSVQTEEKANGIEVHVLFGRQIFKDQSFAFVVEYDLPDRGPRDAGAVRVGDAFGAFYAYAFGEEQAEVRIVFPPGFEATTQGGEMVEGAGRNGSLLLSAEVTEGPAVWWAWVAAERTDALKRTPVEVPIEGGDPAEVVLLSWPEDAEWVERVRTLLTGGLPISLADRTGLAWPVDDPVEVKEIYSPLLGGYAGFYAPKDATITITEVPLVHTVLHEAAHAWFNGRFFRERWIDEGLADEYAAIAATELGNEPEAPLAVERGEDRAFPLNEWSGPAPGDRGAIAGEQYGYAASWLVIRTIASEIGPERMSEVLRAASAGVSPYPGDTEGAIPLPRPVDWRRLLDLFEGVGGSREAGELFEAWVVTDEQAALLPARRSARAAYDLLAQAGGDWVPPLPVRDAMAAWRFDDAEALIATAGPILETRDRIAEEAATLGLSTPGGLEAAYETPDPDLAAAAAIAEEALVTLERIRSATTVLTAPRDGMMQLGLAIEDPEGALAEAKRRFESGDQAGAQQSAERATALIRDAPEIGLQRAMIGAAIGSALLLFLAVAGLLALRRRRGRRQEERLAKWREAANWISTRDREWPEPEPWNRRESRRRSREPWEAPAAVTPTPERRPVKRRDSDSDRAWR